MKNILNKIINFNSTDFHMHTASFSDGLNSIDELVAYAWKIWMSEICITDHSDATREKFESKWMFGTAGRWSLPTYENLQNDVKVHFWVEWDVLDKTGESCFLIQWLKSDFCILSAHAGVYKDSPETVTDATIKAMEKYWDKIKFIGHPTCNGQFGKYYDLLRLVEAANYWKIPLELNGKSVSRWKSDEKNVRYLLENADNIYFNSDAHNLADLKNYRPAVANILYGWWYISQEEYSQFVGLYNI